MRAVVRNGHYLWVNRKSSKDAPATPSGANSFGRTPKYSLSILDAPPGIVLLLASTSNVNVVGPRPTNVASLDLNVVRQLISGNLLENASKPSGWQPDGGGR